MAFGVFNRSPRLARLAPEDAFGAAAALGSGLGPAARRLQAKLGLLCAYPPGQRSPPRGARAAEFPVHGHTLRTHQPVRPGLQPGQAQGSGANMAGLLAPPGPAGLHAAAERGAGRGSSAGRRPLLDSPRPGGGPTRGLPRAIAAASRADGAPSLERGETKASPCFWLKRAPRAQGPPLQAPLPPSSPPPLLSLQDLGTVPGSRCCPRPGTAGLEELVCWRLGLEGFRVLGWG